MSNFRSFDDLNSNPQRDPFTRAANALRGVLCPAYNRFPGLFLPPPLPGTQAIRDANRGFWEDTICPPPPPPTGDRLPQYAPGCSTTYVLTITTEFSNGTLIGTATRTVSGLLWVDWRSVPPLRVDVFGRSSGGQPFTFAFSVPSQSPNGSVQVRSIAISRADGQPPNTPCSIPPVIEPDEIIPPSITVNLGDGPVNINISPVTYDVEGDTYLSPQFNTSIGPIEFSLGGVTFAPQLLPPIIVPPVPGGGGGPTINEIQNVVNQGNQEVTTNISNILEDRSAELAAYIRCLIERPNEQIEPVPLTSSNAGGINVLPSGTFAVVVSRVGNIGTGTRIQSGSNGLPNVVYWGWCATGRNGNYSPRKQLSYDDSIIFVSERENEILVNPVFNNLYSAIALVASNTCVFEE